MSEAMMNNAPTVNAHDDAKDAAAPAPKQSRAAKSKTLVPAGSIAGRALVVVIAIMTFLAALAAVSAILVAQASITWRGDVAREITVQVLPDVGRDLDTESNKVATVLRATPGIASVRVFTKAQSEDLLDPWLGKDGAAALALAELPIPRLVIAQIEDAKNFDFTALRMALATAVPAANLDDHRLWLDRLSAMADSLVAIAVVIFLMVVVAMVLVIGFVTRGAMAGNREIIEVLHFVGATDDFIAREFQKHFLRLGFEGAVLGGSCALAAFITLGLMSRLWRATAGGAQIAAFFGTFHIGVDGYCAILALMILVSFATGYISRAIVYRHLQAMG